MFDEETGEVIENKDTKHIKESLTDPESGCFHKGEKEKCFAYTHQVFCDKNGFVLATFRQSDQGPKRKYYSLTEDGKNEYLKFIESYNELTTAVNTLLADNKGENL